MNIKLEPTATLQPCPTNPRRDHDVDGIARSIEAFGFRQPIVVWDGDGKMLVGHGRLLAAKKLGLDKVPVHHVSAKDLDAEKAAAYRLADNRAAEASEWDDTLLLAELEALDEACRELAGFDEDYVRSLRQTLTEGEWPGLGGDAGGHADGFRQMTFTLSEAQFEVVTDAIAQAKKTPFDQSDNQNSNGNALHAIAVDYVS